MHSHRLIFNCTKASSTATYTLSPRTHLIQLLHVSDDLSGVLHLQHCRPHHHSLLLVLAGVFANEAKCYRHSNITLVFQMKEYI